jgi:hypothetical protein
MTETKKKTRAPGGGRKAADGTKPTRYYQLRLDDAQHAKLLRIGGAVFLRRKITEEVEK